MKMCFTCNQQIPDAVSACVRCGGTRHYNVAERKKVTIDAAKLIDGGFKAYAIYKKIALAVAVVGFAVLLLRVFVFNGPAAETDSEHDAFVTGMMKEGIEEARIGAWLREEANAFNGLDEDGVLKLVADLKRCGAGDIRLCDVVRMGETNLALFICFRLPQSGDLRERIRGVLNERLRHKYEEYYEKDAFGTGWRYLAFTKDV